MVSFFRLPSFIFVSIYIVAILIGRYIDFPFYAVLVLGLLFLALSFFLYKKRLVLAYNIIILLSLLFFFLSYFEYRTDYKEKGHLLHYSDRINAFYGKVTSYPRIKTLNKKFINCKEILRKETIKRQEYIVEVKEARFDSDLIDYVHGAILVKSRHIIKDIRPGSLIFVEASSYSVKGIKPCEDFDYRQFLLDKEIYYISYPFSKKDIYVLEKEIDLNILQVWAGKIHKYLSGVYDRTLTDSDSAMVKAMILGKREGISSDLVSSFRKSGIAHILAISGLHIGMISFFLYGILSIFSVQRRYIFIIVGIILLFYILIVGYKASVLRAVIMFWCFALIFIFDRDRHYYNSLFLACLISLLIYPLSLFQISFQLSFLATFGILLYFNRIERFILYLIGYDKLYSNDRHILNFLRISTKYFVRLLSLTLSAQILIIPIVIYYFKGFSLIAVATNLFVILLVQCLVALAMLLPFVVIVPFLTKIYTAVISFVVQGIVSVSNYFASLSFSYITIDYFKGQEYLFMILYYSAIFIIANMRVFNKKN